MLYFFGFLSFCKPMPIFLVSFCKLATQAWCTFFREKNFYCSPHFPLYERRKSIFESHSLRKKRGETSPLSPPPFFFIRPPTMVPSFAPRKKRGKLPLPRKFKNRVSFWLSEKRREKNKYMRYAKSQIFLSVCPYFIPKRQIWTNAFKDRYSPATAKKAPMAHPIRGGKEK